MKDWIYVEQLLKLSPEALRFVNGVLGDGKTIVSGLIFGLHLGNWYYTWVLLVRETCGFLPTPKLLMRWTLSWLHQNFRNIMQLWLNNLWLILFQLYGFQTIIYTTFFFCRGSVDYRFHLCNLLYLIMIFNF